MPKSGLSKGIRKFIRRQKAEIRRQVLDQEEQEKKIQELYSRLGLDYTKLKNRSKVITGTHQ